VSTNSRTRPPPPWPGDRARVLDVRIFVKISGSGDPDPISFLTKILTSKTRALSPVRKRGSLVHKVVDCSRTIHVLFTPSRLYLILTKILTSKTRALSPVRKRGSLVHKVVDCSRTIHVLFTPSRLYLIFDENPYIQNASTVACPEEGVPCPQSCGLFTDNPCTVHTLPPPKVFRHGTPHRACVARPH
jgi:hypothetical protein